VQTPPAEPAKPQPRSLDEKYVEASVRRLNQAMLCSEAKVIEIESRLRAASGHDDRETIAACVAELLADCETYLVEQREAGTRFHERAGQSGELSSIVEQIELANLEQSAQVETAISSLRAMDFESDLATAAERLSAEIDGLRATRHRLSDSLKVAFPGIAGAQAPLPEIGERLEPAPLGSQQSD
jgi:hypothetical protein